MTGATYFIEVWKTSNGSIINTSVLPIDFLSAHLSATMYTLNCTTIAIWKIKFKTKDNE